MDNEFDLDPSLVAEFIDESLEFLTEVDGLFVQLEATPDDLEIVQGIFRPVHSIKGNSSFFGFHRITTLAHEMETLLDLVRKQSLKVSPKLIGILLEGVDVLKSILDGHRTGDTSSLDQATFDSLVDRVKGEAGSAGLDIAGVCAKVVSSLEQIKSELNGSDTEAPAVLENLITELRGYAEVSPKSSKENRRPWPEPLRRIRNTLATPLEGELEEDKARQVLDDLRLLRRESELPALSEGLDGLVDTVETFMDSVGFDNLLLDDVLSTLDTLDELDAWKVEEAPAQQQPVAAEGVGNGKKGVDLQKTMRVPESYIDTFLHYVGELLVVGDMFNHLRDRAISSGHDWDFLAAFKLATSTFSGLSDDLQTSIMSIRKVSVSTILKKVPRIVRDVAAQSGKKIAVELSGEELQVDKSIMGLLDAPLTHMVRNSADHGIELPEVRRAAGKDPQGTVKISVEEGDSTIVLTVEDDGAGLDYEAIRAKAVSLGLAEEGKTFTNEDIIEFLFSSGVSTAKSVTDVSGRGVGMDVVKRTIEEAGGEIAVTSEAGKGSVFTLTLPKSVTTQIIQGFLVESDGHPYVLPMDKVLQTESLEMHMVTEVAETDRYVRRDGKMIPLLSLSSCLGLPPRNGNDRSEDILVSVSSQHGDFALSVDAVLGVQKIVFREINGLDIASEAIAGGALRGDGTVALILDVDKIAQESDTG